MIWILPLILGCSEDELSEPWQLDRTRILAVRPTVQGDPDIVLGTRAEGRPGETLSFEALTYTPDDEPIGGVMWIACLDEENPNDGCNLDDYDGKDKDDVDLDAESGFIGFEPFLSPVLPIPEGVLDSIPEEEREEGISALVNVIAIPDSEMEKFEDEDEDEEDLKLDVDDYEIAFKRVPVSESTTPNHNPDIVDFVVAGERLDGAAGFTARTEKTYVIEPLLAEGHIETYRYRASSGEVEFRTEEPYFSWFTELGSASTKNGARFDQPFSLIPYTSVEWTAPKDPGEIIIHVVVRDRRGGMGWRSLTVNVL